MPLRHGLPRSHFGQHGFVSQPNGHHYQYLTSHQIMFEDTENMLELLKSLPSSLCILMIIPLVLLSAPSYSSHDFPVFRMQQYDLNGLKLGKIFLFFNLYQIQLANSLANTQLYYFKQVIQYCQKLPAEGVNTVECLLQAATTHLATVLLVVDAECLLQGSVAKLPRA